MDASEAAAEELPPPPPVHPPATLHLEPYAQQERRHWPPAGRHVVGQATADAVVVYQAYAPGITAAAARQRHFRGIPGFSEGRIAWLKTNFLWMMYRSGWGAKANQEGVLAVALRRPFFERLLAASVPTAAGADGKGACRQSEVVLQWDPDHAPDGSKHVRRAVQLGVRGGLRDEYISGRHIISVEDITPFVREMRQRVQQAGAAAEGWRQLLTPTERVVRLSEALRQHVAADSWDGADTRSL